jgi:hypothetical protein
LGVDDGKVRFFAFGWRDEEEAALVCTGALFVAFKRDGENSLSGDIICLVVAGRAVLDVVREVTPEEGAPCFNVPLAVDVPRVGVEGRVRGDETP